MSARGGASSFRHTPYADRLKAFSIGLRPISKAQWIEVDEHLSADLAAKVKIFSEEGVEAFDELACSGVAQDEALDLLAVHLPLHFPDLYRALPAGLTVEGRSVAFEAPKLRAAAQLVQEDLLLMQRFDDGWRLTAGALCFPATWRLGEKLGKPMGEIHAPVPGYAGQMAERIARIFDALPADDLVERINLSIYGDNLLRHSFPRAPHEKFPPNAPIIDSAHVRIERQTLRKLTRSGAILFTVRTYLDPIAALKARTDGGALARALRDHLMAMSETQLAYKGIVEARDRLVEALDGLSKSSG